MRLQAVAEFIQYRIASTTMYGMSLEKMEPIR